VSNKKIISWENLRGGEGFVLSRCSMRPFYLESNDRDTHVIVYPHTTTQRAYLPQATSKKL